MIVPLRNQLAAILEDLLKTLDSFTKIRRQEVKIGGCNILPQVAVGHHP